MLSTLIQRSKRTISYFKYVAFGCTIMNAGLSQDYSDLPAHMPIARHRTARQPTPIFTNITVRFACMTVLVCVCSVNAFACALVARPRRDETIKSPSRPSTSPSGSAVVIVIADDGHGGGAPASNTAHHQRNARTRTESPVYFCRRDATVLACPNVYSPTSGFDDFLLTSAHTRSHVIR